MPDQVISARKRACAPAESRAQYGSVLKSAKRLRQQRDLPVFHDLATRLHSVVDSDFLTLILTIRYET